MDSEESKIAKETSLLKKEVNLMALRPFILAFRKPGSFRAFCFLLLGLLGGSLILGFIALSFGMWAFVVGQLEHDFRVGLLLSAGVTQSLMATWTYLAITIIVTRGEEMKTTVGDDRYFVVPIAVILFQMTGELVAASQVVAGGVAMFGLWTSEFSLFQYLELDPFGLLPRMSGSAGFLGGLIAMMTAMLTATFVLFTTQFIAECARAVIDIAINTRRDVCEEARVDGP
ncbi:MAG: hypothetical protein H6726_19160 [Sandaracinaceae bacterium]|nr:hypothetical protein [Sandaracinaceae bacterium]